jgi:hypothetical protein
MSEPTQEEIEIREMLEGKVHPRTINWILNQFDPVDIWNIAGACEYGVAEKFLREKRVRELTSDDRETYFALKNIGFNDDVALLAIQDADREVLKKIIKKYKDKDETENRIVNEILDKEDEEYIPF